MSDVMPYPSTKFCEMTEDQLEAYRRAWRGHLQKVISEVRPDLIHSNHVWILSSMMKDLAPGIPVVTHCHSTGIRQTTLCPHLAGEVQKGCARNERFVVQHGGLVDELTSALGVARERIHVVGAGYRDDLFHARGRSASARALAYVGKYSHSKGLPSLLDAFERLRDRHSELTLEIAGSGAGSEAERLRERMKGMPGVILHGQLDQPRLAGLLRECSVFVLPSFYEGVPLVLVEALACGCRLVANRLPGILDQLTGLGDALALVPMPRLIGADQPEPADLPAFVDQLGSTIARALQKPLLGDPAECLPGVLTPFSWSAVFGRVEAVWRDLILTD
jgi:glycosyltransferase involved in cell wall biosynthesis